MVTRDRIDGRSPGAKRALGPLAAAALGAVLACSSNSAPHPPIPAGCTEKNGVPCTASVAGGGVSAEGDGSAPEGTSTGAIGDATSCTGATQIFGTTTAACIACIAASCCSNPSSCPNDTSCASVAFCVLNCLPTDPSCVQGCEAQASSATVTAFTDLASCAASSCSVCPTLQTANGDI